MSSVCNWPACLVLQCNTIWWQVKNNSHINIHLHLLLLFSAHLGSQREPIEFSNYRRVPKVRDVPYSSFWYFLIQYP
jgi:hypothetical protein